MHAKPAPVSESNAKLALVCRVRLFGPLVIVAVGATVSIVQVDVSAGPVLPAGSVAVTEIVC